MNNDFGLVDRMDSSLEFKAHIELKNVEKGKEEERPLLAKCVVFAVKRLLPAVHSARD
jgi:hypothetical protein